MAKGHVVAQSCNAGGSISRAHANPIMGTRLYEVEFTGGKVTELTINVTSELMYAQYNAEGNKYLLLDILWIIIRITKPFP